MACPRLCIGKLCNVDLADYRFACFSCSVGIACHNDVQTGGQCAGIDSDYRGRTERRIQKRWLCVAIVGV